MEGNFKDRLMKTALEREGVRGGEREGRREGQSDFSIKH